MHVHDTGTIPISGGRNPTVALFISVTLQNGPLSSHLVLYKIRLPVVANSLKTIGYVRPSYSL